MESQVADMATKSAKRGRELELNEGRDQKKPKLEDDDPEVPMIEGDDRKGPTIEGEDQKKPTIQSDDQKEPTIEDDEGKEPTIEEDESNEPKIKGGDEGKPMLQDDDQEKSKVECDAEESPNIEIAIPLKLVDINEDCLQAIFQHLDVNDLINVAETDDRFIAAAVSVFHRFHRKKQVIIWIRSLCSHQTSIRNHMATAFFSHFSHSVAKLFLDLSMIDDDEVDLDEIVQPNRLTSLVELQLHSCTEVDFEEFNGPFEKVEKLTIGDSVLGENLVQLNEWFPNLNYLKLYNVSTLWLESLEVHYLKLKQLTIFETGLDIPHSTIIKILEHNPQLESLILHTNVSEYFLRSIEAFAQQLKHLDICALDDRFFNFDDSKVYFENVEKFAFTCDFVVNIPFTFKSLQELSLHGFYLQLMDFDFKLQLLDFLSQNDNLVKLNLDFYEGAWEDIELDDMTEIVESLPKLRELQFRADVFDVDDLIQFLTEHIALKKIQLTFLEMDQHQFIRDSIQELESKWTITTHKDNEYCYIDFDHM